MRNILLLLFTALVLSGCADVENVQECVSGHTYGFWGGLWHGMIAFWSFLGSLAYDDIGVWANNNNGGWYAFGFIIGVGSFSSAVKAILKVVK